MHVPSDDPPPARRRQRFPKGIVPFFAYPFLVLTFVGWMAALVKGQ